MRQRVSLITLGVAEIGRARSFYEALGWSTGADPGEEARAAGAEIGREPAETFWGGYSGLFLDPDGHPWEIAHNPHWRLSDDGAVRLN